MPQRGIGPIYGQLEILPRDCPEKVIYIYSLFPAARFIMTVIIACCCISAQLPSETLEEVLMLPLSKADTEWKSQGILNLVTPNELGRNVVK